jgi:flagellum-specific ATP synthase
VGSPPDLERYRRGLIGRDLVRALGTVRQVVGLVIEAVGQVGVVGDLCEIRSRRRAAPLLAEIVGFREGRLLLMPLGELHGIGPGSEVVATHRALSVPAGPGLLGRVLSALGEPLDGGPPIPVEAAMPVQAPPPAAMGRRRILEPLPVGVRAIDGLLTCGKGQRVGIFSGSGVGKSTLLGMIARNTAAEVNVIGLIGERGRELKDFLEKDLGPEGLRRSVLVVATSDEPPLLRRQAAFTATAVAEYFRGRGRDVILMMDSVTRFAMAQREIGLTIGEPPTTRGYPPSAFAMLPRLLERAGTAAGPGSITGLYTILVEGDDMNEPIADAARSILDGHVVLTRELAARNHYPPVDVLQSVSRLMLDVTDPEHQAAAARVREALAAHREVEDLLNIGAYVPGSNPRVDQALRHLEGILGFLRQGIAEGTDYRATLEHLARLVPGSGGAAREGASGRVAGVRTNRSRAALGERPVEVA